MRQRTSTFFTDQVAVGGICLHHSLSCGGAFAALAIAGATMQTVRTQTRASSKRRMNPSPFGHLQRRENANKPRRRLGRAAPARLNGLRMRKILVTGMSGTGKSTALTELERRGF